MSGIKEDFDGGYLFDRFGKITGTSTATALPNVPTSLVRFKIASAPIFLGTNANDCIYLLDTGDDTGWIPTHNLNKLFIQCVTGTTGYLYYWAKL